jgi:FkbM family methyltransferase
MLLMGRDPRRILSAPFQAKHYVALANMVRTYPAFGPALVRYLTNSGKYPHALRVRTPAGIREVTLYSYHDLLTVNEVFCRGDYRVEGDIRVAVDLGANIGVSCLYFLTHSPSCRCYAYEPVPRNVERLTANLAPFRDRVFLEQAAVADFSGASRFTIEDTGRYGGLGQTSRSNQTIQVRCLHVNEVISRVLEREPAIDVLKIDTEGNEEAIIKAIDPQLMPFIKLICYESNSTGGVTRLIPQPAAAPAVIHR